MAKSLLKKLPREREAICEGKASPMATPSSYSKQTRGNDSDYERYLRGMDASMQQKVALTAAHLLGGGWLADMGMGSGTGSEALAALYPQVRVTGVDINPEMVSRAQAKYKLKNLDFRVGDIAGKCFEDESLEVIFNSSVLHHVTTFNHYDKQMAHLAIARQVQQLKVGGNLIIRDFLRPESGKVFLDLPLDTVPIFERFAREFRFLKEQEDRGIAYRYVDSQEKNWKRIELEAAHAVEFVLRKDYLEDWETEILEEYTYFTQAEFEAALRKHGMRILASTPLRNPWIVKNRFEGKFRLYSLEGEPLEYPPTNYLVVGEKVPPKSGVAFSYGPERPPQGFLELAHYQCRATGALRDLVRRPNATLDVIPYFLQDNEVYVIARKSFPRPILELCHPRLDGCRSPSYVTEPIVISQGDKPLAQTVEEALATRVGIAPDQIKAFRFGGTTYPSPGGLQEEVRAVFVEVEEILESGTQHKVRAVSARQLMRAAQVGGLPDARLELHCFELLQILGLAPGAWIGEQLSLHSQVCPPPEAQAGWPEAKPRRAFQKSKKGADFLHLGCREFTESSAQGDQVSSLPLDYVVARKQSLHTVSVALLWQHQKEPYLGLYDDDFPSAQCFAGHSNLLVTPAWRLPFSVSTLGQMEEFLIERLEAQHAVIVRECFSLGGPYFPSAGVTPEVVYPLACDVQSVGEGAERLLWLPLREVLGKFDSLRDGHLKTVVSRVARALES